MQLSLIRKVYTEKSTIGELSVNGKFVAHILEDVVRAPGEAKVYGKTAIPAGTYKMIVNKSERFSQKAGADVLMPRLLNVPGFDGILLHTGNDETASLGCLIIGQYDPKKPNWVSNSRVEFNDLYPVLWAAQVHQDPIAITITDTKIFPPKAAKTGKKA